MAARHRREFRNAIREIAINATNLQSHFDRVRCAEWCRKLASLPEDDFEVAKRRNDYIQLLRIQVRHRILHTPFSTLPPERDNIVPLEELLGSIITAKLPELAKPGPIAPVVQHKSPDGKACLSIKQIPEGGIFCYLAVSPEGLDA